MVPLFRQGRDRAEYRRRKRLSLAARGRRSLWRNTPTPERGTRAWEEIEEDNQRDYETLELGWVPLGDCPACEAPWRARHPCDTRVAKLCPPGTRLMLLVIGTPPDAR